ncbi:MAG: hypothetical protein R3C18_26995 [Planctomycetaceae bacterium]
MNDEYGPDVIQHLEGLEGIRHRPELYIGPIETLAALNTLLAESLCIALANANGGCASEVTIKINDDGNASVRDNGPGLELTKFSNGRTLIEVLFTEIYACRAHKDSKDQHAFCEVGIVTTTALSEWLVVETVRDGWLWEQRFERGKVTGPIERRRECTEQWQQISFLPDHEIFGAAKLSPSFFKDWFLAKKYDLGQAKVTFVHGVESLSLNPRT